MPNSSPVPKIARFVSAGAHAIRPRRSRQPHKPLGLSVPVWLLPSVLAGALVLASCWVGDPFVQAEPAPPDAGPAASVRLPGEPELGLDPRLPAPPTPAPDAEAVGFSATRDGRLVAFGAQTGSIRAEIPLGNEIRDLQWLPQACRLVAQVAGQGASQRVFSFALRHAPDQRLALTLEDASEELWGPTHILGVEGSPTQASAASNVEALWLVSGDPALTWQRLDSELTPLGVQAGWPQPQGWSALPGGSVVTLLGSGEASELALATFGGDAPRLERRPLPHAVALAAEGGRVWVWIASNDLTVIQTLDLPAFKLTDQSSNFPRSAPRALVVSASRLAAYQIDGDGAVRILLQARGVTRTRRFAQSASSALRPLAMQGDYLWYASTTAISRLHLPDLSPRMNFDGAALRAPVVVPPAKTLRCIR